MNFREETELYLLAYVLYCENCGTVFSAISEEEFSDRSVRGAYNKAKSIWQEKGEMNLPALQNICNPEELGACRAASEYYYPSVDIEAHIENLKDLNALQEVERLADELKLAENMSEVTDTVGKLEKLTRGAVKSQSLSAKNYIENFLPRMTAKLDSFQTGFSKLDRYLVISPGDFVILAGEQSSGKTAFSLELMNRFAKRGYRCAYFSLETEENKLGDRAFCNYANLDFNNVKRRDLDGDDWELVGEKSEEYGELPIEFVPAAGKTVAWIKAEALRQNAEIIFVDYLGLISPSKGSREKSYEIATNISKELHTLAQSEKITVIALQQQNRENVGSASMHSLRDSSQLESDADAILILTIPKDEYGKSERDYSQAYLPSWEEHLHIAKNKDGDRVTMSMTFDGQHQRFYEREERYE